MRINTNTLMPLVVLYVYEKAPVRSRRALCSTESKRRLMVITLRLSSAAEQAGVWRQKQIGVADRLFSVWNESEIGAS